jgi:hypothetical protein
MLSNVKNFFNTLVNSIKNRPYKTLAVVFIFGFLEWYWGFEASFFISLFFLFWLLKFDFRILISFALLFLISCPLYLIDNDSFRAEQMAIYAYYLLFIGVILSLIELAREKKAGEDKDEEHE